MLKPLTVWITTNCGKFLKRWGYPRNLYAGQEATVSTGHGTMTGSKLGKEYIKAIYCHPAYLTYMWSTSCEMQGWMTHKLESRLQEKYPQPHICKWYHSNGIKWWGNKEPFDECKRESEKSGLKCNIKTNKQTNYDWSIQFHHFIANRWETVVAVTLFWGSKITVDSNCSQEIKRHFFLEGKL